MNTPPRKGRYVKIIRSGAITKGHVKQVAHNTPHCCYLTIKSYNWCDSTDKKPAVTTKSYLL